MPLSGQSKRPDFGLSFTPKRSAVIFEQTELGESTAQFGLNVQAIIGYEISDRWQLQSGIGYQLSQVQIIDYTPTLGCDFDGVSFDLFNSWFENKGEIHYLAISFATRYQLSRKTNFPYLKLGYQFLYKLRERQETSLVECGASSLPLSMSFPFILRDTGGMATFGLGYEWTSGSHSKLFIEPELSYGLIPVYDEIGVIRSRENSIRLVELGLRIGVRL